jgi:hypothetical protein
VKSHYLALIHLDVPNLSKRLWKLKAPLKIKNQRGGCNGGERGGAAPEVERRMEVVTTTDPWSDMQRGVIGCASGQPFLNVLNDV